MDLDKGRIDAICSAVTVTEERRGQFDFSLPYLNFHLAAICRSNTLLPDLPSMRDKKIGVRTASEAERYIRGHLINPILEIHNTNDELYGLLKNSEIDVLIDDSPIAGAFVKQSQSALAVSFLLPDSQSQYAIAFKKGSELKPLIDKALTRIGKHGRLDGLRMKWLGLASN